MTEQWRLLQTGFRTAYSNMAVDKAILVATSKGKVPPTVRFYGWNPPAFLLVISESEDEIDIEACERVVSIMYGGSRRGAVFIKKNLRTASWFQSRIQKFLNIS